MLLGRGLREPREENEEGDSLRTFHREVACLTLGLSLLLFEGPVAAQDLRSSAAESAALPAADSPQVFLDRFAPTLGNESSSRLRMKFEVTFMKIDVADLEARVAPQISARIEPLARSGQRNREVEDRIADLLMDPDAPILLAMTYLRDADYGRFSKGLRTSMTQAAESGAITEAEAVELTGILLDESAPLAETGVSEGGVLAHYVDGDTVRIVYLTPNGAIQIDSSRSDATLGRALRASWFGERSRFREKLLRSLFE